jgi:hypothetical protein
MAFGLILVLCFHQLIQSNLHFSHVFHFRISCGLRRQIARKRGSIPEASGQVENAFGDGIYASHGLPGGRQVRKINRRANPRET